MTHWTTNRYEYGAFGEPVASLFGKSTPLETRTYDLRRGGRRAAIG